MQVRADLLVRLRAFFAQRHVLEVEVPVLQTGANLDSGVQPMPVETSAGRRWLITSPEHYLKRLLAAGMGDCWTLSPAFRAGEHGARHRSEFRIIEWYRCGWDDRRLASETVALLSELTGVSPTAERKSYRQAFREACGLDPLLAATGDLAACLSPADRAAAAADRHAVLDLLFTQVVAPCLVADRFTIIEDFPPDQAAQARLRQDGFGAEVAARFEVFHGTLELANGYDELTSAEELVNRLQEECRHRRDTTLDHRFLAAMQHGLPACAGVAVGFDRVVMLALGSQDIARSQAFANA